MDVQQELERNRFNMHAAAAIGGRIARGESIGDLEVADAFYAASRMMQAEAIAWESYLLRKAQATIDTKRKEQGLT